MNYRELNECVESLHKLVIGKINYGLSENEIENLFELYNCTPNKYDSKNIKKFFKEIKSNIKKTKNKNKNKKSK